MDQPCADLLAGERQIARAEGVDSERRIAGGLAAIHIREGCAVDDRIRLVAADIVDGGLAVGDVQLIDIHRDNGGLAQTLGQGADGTALLRKLALQLGAQLTAAAGNQNFHRFSPPLRSILQLVSATFFRC